MNWLETVIIVADTIFCLLFTRLSFTGARTAKAIRRSIVRNSGNMSSDELMSEAKRAGYYKQSAICTSILAVIFAGYAIMYAAGFVDLDQLIS